MKELFKDFDKNNNKIIDEKEFEDGVTKWVNRAMDVANAADKGRIIEEFDRVNNTF